MGFGDIAAFRRLVKEARRTVILTGAGVSAESGIPTFRGEGGLWRTYPSTRLATPEAFKANPSLVWEFYHYRREVARKALPNRAHEAIARLEAEAEAEARGRRVTVVTQNVDNLHARAGSKNLVELHGNLYKTRCTKCKEVAVNEDSPVCEALAGKGAPEPDAPAAEIPPEELPRCRKEGCSGLLRPHIVWFGENLERKIIDRADEALEECDLCVVIGTSSAVYPAAAFAPRAASRGVPVAEFNVEPTPRTHEFQFYFQGKCGITVPEAFF